MKNKVINTSKAPTLIPRLVVGLIFLSEGIQKFVYPDIVGTGRFAKIGFENPEFWAAFTGYFEIGCSVFLLVGLFTRIAAIPLIVIMITAFFTTKWPILLDKGLGYFAHEYRTDFAMTMLLIFLIYHGGGNFSLDFKISASKIED